MLYFLSGFKILKGKNEKVENEKVENEKVKRAIVDTNSNYKFKWM